MPSASENEQGVAPASGAGSEERLRESLKRCSPATVEAALCYRRTKDVAQIPVVVLGIIARFTEPGAAARLAAPDDDLRVMEDLGLDSLTLMEAIILVEEVLQISINNDELRNLRTIGDIKTFIDHKARGLPPPQPSRYLPLEAVAAVMPQQPPFLFVREATLSSGWATGSYTVGGDEAFLAGHFKDNPVFPASIMLEALGQLAVLHLLQAPNSQFEQPIDPRSILFTGVDGVRCHRVCRPGDVLKLSVKPKRLRAPLGAYEGSIRVGHEKAVSVEEITLAFSFVPATPAAADGAPTAPAAP
jgi:3-hydroxyacyl-[acyl-carrier-protein] dehydratase